MTDPIAHNIRRIAHLDLMGAGQVTVDGNYAYVGHITNSERLGTTILDVSDPANPRVVSTIMLDDPDSHSHKARVAGDILVVNAERNNSGIGRKAEQLPGMRERLHGILGREPNHRELADRLGVEEVDIPVLEEAEKHPYDKGGFKLYDISNRARPELIAYQKTGGIGVHRFDMDARLRLHLDRDGRLRRQHPGDLRHPRSGASGRGVALVDAGSAHRRRRDAGLAGAAEPAAPRAALRRRDVGRVLARRAAGHRRSRHRQAQDARRIQLPPAVPGADAHGDAAAVPARRPAHLRWRSTRRTSSTAPPRRRRGAADRTRRCGPST